jgi:putative hydrolase of the HAD superfamily
MSSKYASIYFDLYSTLLYESSHNPFYERVAEELNIDKTAWLSHYGKRKYESMAGAISGMDQRVALSLSDAGYKLSPEAVTKAVDRNFPLFVDNVSLYPDTLMTLKALKQRRLPLGLISNASDHSVAIFRGLDLEQFFDSVVFSFEHRCLKPDPAIYRVALKELKQNACQALYVGDGGDQELRGAKAMGFTTVLLDRGLPHTEQARADADHVFTGLRDVLDLVDHS